MKNILQLYCAAPKPWGLLCTVLELKRTSKEVQLEFTGDKRESEASPPTLLEYV